VDLGRIVCGGSGVCRHGCDCRSLGLVDMAASPNADGAAANGLASAHGDAFLNTDTNGDAVPDTHDDAHVDAYTCADTHADSGTCYRSDDRQ